MRSALLISMAALAATGCPGALTQCPAIALVGAFVVTVTDELGDPVCGAAVTLTTDNFLEEVISDSDGRAVADGADSGVGVYSITVTADGFEPVTIDDVVQEHTNVVVVDGVCVFPQVRLDVSLIEQSPRPNQFVFGVTVSVNDENGNAVSDASVRLFEDEYSETMMEIVPGVFVGAGERAGTYTLTVEADDFEPATIPIIRVEQDICQVVPVTRTVTLVAA